MKKLIAANWKLQKNPKETEAFLKSWLPESEAFTNLDFVIFTPATNLETAARCLEGAETEFGAQNIYSETSGAFTGETSAKVVKEIGAQWCLVGHSERRTLFKEDNALLAKKMATAISAGLEPMLCVGESLEEREGGVTEQVLKSQLVEGLKLVEKGREIVVAYEPVWAIGTGKVATPEQVAETHKQVRAQLVAMGFPKNRILYGGSVKADNAGQLSKIANVDGFLVGGASLDVPSFAGIAKAVQAL